MNKKLITKCFSLILVMLMLVLITGCGKTKSEKLWNTYVKAVNAQDIDAVALTFYQKGNATDTFVSENSDYFTKIKKIETINYEETINCDFSGQNNVQAYYKAEVKALVTTDTGENEISFPVYIYSNNNGIFFCSELDFSNTEELGNKPNSYWTNKVYFTNDDYQYDIDSTNKTATILRNISNPKEVVIPSELEGNVVTTIAPYAYYHLTKILSFTFPKSKMKSLTIPDTITTIGKYAFFQCVKLKEITIPKSVTSIDEMAFTGCSRVETINLLYNNTQKEFPSCESTSTGGDDMPLVIENAREMLIGEITKLTVKRYDAETETRSVKWSISSGENIATINADTGELFVKGAGRVSITVALKSNRTVSATVTIEVHDVEEFTQISFDAFNRCGSLKTLNIYATNPNYINIINGTMFNFSDQVTIYVPYGSKAMYTSNAIWSTYAKQIQEMPNPEAE